jgi:cobyric acid synthase CobQ/L-threonine-O-3-phosphate decarboxylase
MMAAEFPHGGNLRRLAESAGIPAGEILDFSANINPLGPPEWMRRVVSAQLSSTAHYPDPHCTELLRAAAAHYQVARDEIAAGNGSSELLYAIPRVLPCRRAVIAVPCYTDYRRAAERAGIEVRAVALDPANGFRLDFAELERAMEGGSLVMVGQPNNPTGVSFDADTLRALAARHADSWFVIDEAFADFVGGLDRLTRRRPPNVIVLLSATKNWAIPGLRLGFAIADSIVADRLRAALPPWSVNSLAQAVGCAAFGDAAYLERSRRQVAVWRSELKGWLSQTRGIEVFPGEANFLLARTQAAGLHARLLRRGIAIRDCSNFEGLDASYFRAAVRTGGENARLADAVSEELTGAPAIRVRRRRPALMFQGTSSNAGKSVLAAGLCRVMLEDGFRVAPFKAQNMSLNSYVTADGLEMGRAQVVQAQACRLDPDVRMNPILLKPNTDTGSQVILRGRPVGNMEALDYFRFKAKAFEEAKRCYDELAAEHDAVVLEGAGSPAEVNLKKHDIVNMTMARHAGAPVLLVGDIDRGGVYAAFVGCMEVFTEQERARVAGFVVNKFRGKQSLLGEANDYVLAHTGKAVLGVVPYLGDLGLPEEDSVSFKQGDLDDRCAVGERVEIAVIDLPHISNFTDLDALRLEPDVRVRVVRSAEELGVPAAIVLPGSKNVPGDLRYLVQTGLAGAIAEAARSGVVEVVGICGGFQMLGETVTDPHRLESDGADVAGLALLPVTTMLEREKTLRRTSATHVDSGLEVRGYEIHHGQTVAAQARHALLAPGGEPMGTVSRNGLVWGCYLHGIFDADPFRRWFIDRLRTRRGMEPAGRVLARYDIEPALDRLAATLRACLPVEALYRRMGLR